MVVFMGKSIGFWHSSARGRKGRHTTNAELAETAAFTREEAIRIAKKKFGKGKYTISFTHKVESPSPGLIQTLGRKVLGK